jgi:hypothetical protein
MPTKPPAEGLKHTVKQGQWVGSIALIYGFADWEKDVWEHADNAQLKELRKDPHVLAPGDELFIPPWTDKKESCATESRHSFKLKTPNETIRVRILDEDGEPVKNAKYVLELEYEAGGGTFKQKNTTTDGEGVLTEVIPSTVRSGIVRVPDAKLEIQLDFGLAPLNAGEELAILGAKQRLSALGFYRGPIDSQSGPGLSNAVEAFQRFCVRNKDSGDPSIMDPGEITAELNDKTKEALLKYYGC